MEVINYQDLEDLDASTCSECSDWEGLKTALLGHTDLLSEIDGQHNVAPPTTNLALCATLDGKWLEMDETHCVSDEMSYFFRDLRLIVHTVAPNRLSIRTDHPTPYMEWKVVVQTRIRSGPANKSLMRVVDSAVFGLGKYDESVFIELDHGHGPIGGLMLEMRTINYYFESLLEPLYDRNRGDVVIDFGDDEPLYTYSALLKLHSTVFASMLAAPVTKYDPAGRPVLQFMKTDRREVMELLSFMLPNTRPINTSFRTLIRAAIRFQCMLAYERAVEFFVAGVSEADWMNKSLEALSILLRGAANRLIFAAVKRGDWDRALGSGWEPKAFYGEEIFYEYLADVVINARAASACRVELPIRPQLLTRPSMDSASPDVVRLMVAGHCFVVHRGLLQAHNIEAFGVDDRNDSILYPRVSVELRKCLEHEEVGLDEMLEQFVALLYPSGVTLQRRFLIPLLIFAHDHHMAYLKHCMEEGVMSVPPDDPAQLLAHLELAESFRLKNLMHLTMCRVEGQYMDMARQLTMTYGYVQRLSRTTLNALANRLAAGWSLSNPNLASMNPTQRRLRLIYLNEGGPLIPREEDLSTFHSFDSDVAFGGPRPEAQK